MPQIRNTKIQNIYNSIKKFTIFSINDFKIDFPDNGSILVHISFRASSKYSFIIHEKDNTSILNIGNQKRDIILETIEKPGDSKNQEQHEHKSFDNCIDRIHFWLRHLDEDLRNEFNFESNIQDISNIEKFEKKLNEKFTDENEKFTKKEKENLIITINNHQKRIEQLEQNKDTKEQIQILETSKNELETYPKKAWYLKIYNKLSSFDNTLTLLNNIFDNVTKLVDKF
jgi:hypothetical protein